MNPDTPIPEAALPLSDHERLERNKALLFSALKRAGGIRATVSYRGGGDEGFFEDTEASAPGGACVDLSETVSVFRKRYALDNGKWATSIVEQEQPLDAALCDYATEVVEQHHGGWENGEGGYGQVVFDGKAATVRLEHYDYVVESEYTETVL